jgi:hypothetical protein
VFWISETRLGQNAGQRRSVAGQFTTAIRLDRADLSRRRWEAVVMRAKRRRYAGELATPIVWPAPPTFEGAVTKERVQEYRRKYENHQREAGQRVEQKLLEKISLLMKHYGITDENDTTALAWELAFKHVPGFKIVPEVHHKKGRKKEWHGGKLRELYDIVQSVKEQHKFNDRQALKFVSNNPQYTEFWGPPKSYQGSKQQWVETLESRLQDAKRYLAWIDSLPALLKQIAEAVVREKFRK